MSYTLFYSPGAASFAVHWMLFELKRHLLLNSLILKVVINAPLNISVLILLVGCLPLSLMENQ